MPMSRLAAGIRETSLPSTVTEPESAASKPARMRSAVVLPQPDGPSSATSSPGAISSDRPARARTAPKWRVRGGRGTGAAPSAGPAGAPAAPKGRRRPGGAPGAPAGEEGVERAGEVGGGWGAEL